MGMIRITLAVAVFFVGLSAFAQEPQTWSEANKRSVQEYEAKEFVEAARLSRLAAELYPRQSKAYKSENHAQLILNAYELSFRGDGGEASLQYLEQGLVRLQEKAGRQDVSAAPIAARLAVVLANSLEYEKSDRYFQRACSLADDNWGKDDIESISYLIDWAQATRDFNGLSWARTKLSEARRRSLKYGEDNLLALRIDLLLAKMTVERRAYKVAAREYKAVIQKLEKRDDDETLLENAYAQLAYVYSALDDDRALDQLVQKLGTTYTGSTQYIEPLVRVHAKYPNFAEYLKRGQLEFRKGYVVLEFTVDELGRVIKPEVVDSKGGSPFEAEAIKAVKKWRYRPHMVDGERRKTPGVRAKFNFEGLR